MPSSVAQGGPGYQVISIPSLECLHLIRTMWSDWNSIVWLRHSDSLDFQSLVAMSIYYIVAAGTVDRHTIYDHGGNQANA